MDKPDYSTAPYILDEEGNPLLVWRGESSGIHYQTFDMRKTNCQSGFFFAEVKQQADQYAARGTDARPFHLAAYKVLDLLDPYTPANLHLLNEYAKEYDEWIDRFSGEPCGVHDLIEGGYLYDYEGNGTGVRWNYLFRFAHNNGYDAVRVMDATDGITAPVLVVFEPEQITHAELPAMAHDNRNQRPGRR